MGAPPFVVLKCSSGMDGRVVDSCSMSRRDLYALMDSDTSRKAASREQLVPHDATPLHLRRTPAGKLVFWGEGGVRGSK